MATVIPPAGKRRLLSRLLDPARSGRAESEAGDRRVGPFRGQLLGAEGLATHARALARRQRVAAQEGRVARRWMTKVGPGPLLGRLDDTERLLERTRDELTTAADNGIDVSSAGDWLLDNFYIVQEQIREIRSSLPRGYYQELPKLAEGSLAGYPRVYELAIELIAHTEGHLDLENIGLFVREFQGGAPLNMGELWAVPSMLRLGLVENIRRLALRVGLRLEELQEADEWSDRLQDASRLSPRALTDALGEFVEHHPPLTPVFVSRLFQQIRGYQAEFRRLLWLEQWIAEEALSPEDAVARSNQRLALTQVMMANHVTSLRRIARLDWETFFESQSLTETVLRGDPSRHYAEMTFDTRDRYRHIVEDVARGAGRSEEAVAREAVALAEAVGSDVADGDRRRHVGYFLVDRGRATLEQAVGYRPTAGERLYRALIRHPSVTYFTTIAVLAALVLTGLLALVWPDTAAAQGLLILLALIPVSEIAIGTANQLVTFLLPPARLPKMEFRERGLPEQYRTVVVVPTLLPSLAVVHEQLEHLEIQYLANRDPNLQFAILSDFIDADAEHTPGDDAILAAAADGVRALNRAYGGGAERTFYLLHRSRTWNPRQGVWMGWERKRGKLAQLNAFLLGGPETPFTTIVGDLAPLRGARYVVTLDSDTTLPHDTATLLAGTLAHPLNRPRYSVEAGRVIDGYGILQPRIGVALASAYRSRFAAIHSGHPGVDPYTTAVSDVYQDLYCEGSYTGKGIYDVETFERATAGRFPENALLSHDLIEGAFARAALATDLELFDDYPASYLSHARRKHRWIRGDWQLLPWLRSRVRGAAGPETNPLSTISRWKILDNLRRSLLEPSLLALLLAGWLLLPGSALVWCAVVLGVLAWPWAFGFYLAAIHPPSDKSWRGYYAAVLRDFLASGQQFVLTAIFLPHQAALSVDAIVRTLYRLRVSRRHLLEWQTASQVERKASVLQRDVWRRMAPALAIALVVGAIGLLRGDFLPILPLAALWLASPAIARFLVKPPPQRELRLSPNDRVTARRYALLHWRFFEQFVTDATHGLAPDNFQETPEPVVAARTSPTNIGLQLLSIVTARDLGFITTPGMIERLEEVFRSLQRMRRHRGHFFNWYDLTDLHVLEPGYVSTVDSGNLAGHLLALKQACLEPADEASPATIRSALRAAIGLALEPLAQPPADDGEPREQARLRARAHDAAADQLRGALKALAGFEQPATMRAALEGVRDAARAAERVLAPADDAPGAAVPDHLWWIRWVVGASERRLAELGQPDAAREERTARLRVLAAQAHAYAIAMDFRLLFDRRRKLFSIGFREATATLDPSYYDLLASEARLASFVAIAKDDASPEHWFRLGRSLTMEHGATALVSWSGSMFEYLMPLLVMRALPYTLLDQTHHGAVRRHMLYGREQGTPWGISESAYNVRDRHGTYQYRAFGVPDLALKRGLGKELVVAPYATLLALMVEPRAGMENLGVLERAGTLGPYGFRDALDYSRPEPETRGGTVVCTYMAHHIGMGLVALANALDEQRWQRRFHSDALTRSAELLLAERIPRRFVAQEPQPVTSTEGRVRDERERPAVREYSTADTRQPQVALLGSLPYTVMVTNAGAGYSRYDQMAVTRWRADGTRDNHGQWCYIKDLDDGRVWSAGRQPIGGEPSSYHAVFATDRVTFHRRDGDIETRMEIAVVPDDRAEVRRITLTNHSWSPRELELTSYGEIVLESPDADRAHPAFGNLFVETEWIATQSAILASRRPRSAHENRLWCAHVAAVEHGARGAISYETDRARFIGRGRTVANPAALDDGARLSGSAGAVLDPIFALRVRVRVPAGRSAKVAFTTLVDTERDRAIELADRYNDLYGAQRAFDLSWTRSQMELQDVGASATDAALFQQIAGYLLYPHPGVRASADELARNTRSQEALWAYGISGDLPILLALIHSLDGIDSVRQLLNAHYYWRLHGMAVDLVILNTNPPTYLQDLADEILSVVRSSTEAAYADQPGGVFIRRQELLSPDDVALLRAVARVHIVCDGLGIGAVRDLPDAPLDYPAPFTPTAGTAATRKVRRAIAGNPEPAPRSEQPAQALSLFNGTGGLTPSLGYEIRLSGTALPPAPWANVVANPRVGFVVTESGGGFTWVENSFFFRLTPWSNDPVTDPPADIIYLRDEDTGEIWSATPAPIRHPTPYVTRHDAGATVFSHEHTNIATTLTLAVPEDDPVRIGQLAIANHGTTPRRIGVVSYLEWTLGVNRERTQYTTQTRFDRASQAIFAQNYFEKLFADQVAFSWMSAPLVSHTADRREFLGRNGSPAQPDGLTRQRLAERTGADLDPCAALQSVLTIPPGGEVEVVLLLGAARGVEAARALIDRYRPTGAAAAAVATAARAWEHRLGVIRVRTPSPEFDAVLNRWTFYQALACRMWARSALYQSSGAYGFRDQLQDGMAFVYAEPGITRAHIVESAGRQFVEGDVQHWWHPQSGRGVRTRFSDDLVWLAFCTEQYVRVTGDQSVLDESAPFLRMRALAEGEDEAYDLPQDSGERGTVYQHCLRALRKAATRGVHGLPLIGSGDWNDGMNRVGHEGRGESVWLAWFLIDTLRGFAGIAARRGDGAAAGELNGIADGYTAAVDSSAWDGAWYRRAYFDDGTPLGTVEAEECRIDSIAQSWSVISGAGAAERQSQAMASLETNLVRDDARLIMLLTPPFDHMSHDPGYIKGYVPGVRENGAQYTHAALWAVLATALRGDGERAFALFQMLNPFTHAADAAAVDRYKVEPYVVAADIYTADGHLGRGGWTWYTGSAAWMYRVGLEAIMGFLKEGETLTLDPHIPAAWDGFELEYRHGRATYAVSVRNPAHVTAGVSRVVADGIELPNGRIPLADDGARHDVEVTLGARRGA